LSKKVDELHF